MATSFDPSAILGNLTAGYMKLPLVQKVLFPILIVGSVMGIVYVSKWANQPEYVTLFSDLDPSDSAAVIENLKELKVAYQVRGDGSVISITPPEMVHELRMTLAGNGIPKGGKVGLEIFEATNLGTTTFQEKVKFLRAIQGELERTITSLDSVMSARVHIAQPEKSVFANRSNETTASVMLRLRSPDQIEKKQIRGIQRLVAGSVEGLVVENVSILDANGELLTQEDDGSEEGLEIEATRLAYQREVEREYVRRIEQMLSRVLGQGKSVARVSAEMDFTQSEREEETYDPGGQVLRSERTISEGLAASQRGGIPGVVSNLQGGDSELLAPPSTETTGRSESLRNFEVSRAVSRISSPRGQLMKLSVAVIVDGTPAPEAVAEGEEAKAVPFTPLEPEVLNQIESVVKSAVGYDPSRGDTVTVENIPFASHDNKFEEMLATQAQYDWIFNGIFRVGPLLFLLLFFLFIVRPLIKFLITPTEAEIDLERLLPTGVRELEAELEAERNKVTLPTSEPTIDMNQLEELMAENSRIVQENPTQAALLIRYWLNDGRL